MAHRFTRAGLGLQRPSFGGFLDPGAESLQRINISAGDSFSLEQSTNGMWQISSPSKLPADEELVFALLGRLRNMEAVSREREVVGDFPRSA